MKLKNKETGEIKPAEAREDGIYLYDETTEQWYKYELSLLAEYWEYYEEPEKYFWIDVDGFIVSNDISTKDVAFETFTQNLKSIGNYFETKEEAEKAVKKLKAWKRLKDKRIRFDLDFVTNTISFTYRIDSTLNCVVSEERIIFEDMKTIFGGEE